MFRIRLPVTVVGDARADRAITINVTADSAGLALESLRCALQESVDMAMGVGDEEERDA